LDIQPDLPMTSEDEKRFFHVQRPAAVRHHETEIGKIDRDIIELHRIAVLRARARENGGTGVDHHGEPALLAAAVDLAERGEAVGVGVRGEGLVRWMDLDELYP